MSRIAKCKVTLPSSVEVTISSGRLTVKGRHGKLELELHEDVIVSKEAGRLTFAPRAKSWVIAGTTRALVKNMVTSVDDELTRLLSIDGVGYRATVSGKTINLTLGFSHPVKYQLPEGIKATTPSNTTIVLKGTDKQKLGQVAAEIRAFRPPSPYKGKGVRYSEEVVHCKEAKRK